MFTPFVFIYTFFLPSAVRSTINPEPSVLNITDEACLIGGFWTEWFSMYNAQSDSPPDAQSTYNILMDIANASCSTTIGGMDIQQIQEEMGTKRMARSASNLDVIGVFLQSLAKALSQIDFRLRFCCLAGFTGMDTTSDQPETGDTEDPIVPTVTDDLTTLYETTSSSTTSTDATLMSLDNAICGRQEIAPRPSLTSRIFGGMDAIANSWPWVSP
jgi:hypothetical protein